MRLETLGLRLEVSDNPPGAMGFYLKPQVLSLKPGI
jgi:hypothetical protein